MPANLNNIELIEQYFEGKLSEPERLAFEARLLAEPIFKEELQLYKNVVAGIRSSGEENLKNKLKAVDQELDGLAKVVDLNPKKRSYIPIGIAASLILIIGLSLYWFGAKNKLSALADDYYIKDKGLPVEMSIDKNNLDELMNKYKTGDYLASKTILESLLKTEPANDTLNFFMGLVNYELSDYANAVENLKSVQITSQYHDKSEFYMTLAYLKLNDQVSAQKMIDLMVLKPTHPFINEANQLSKDLFRISTSRMRTKQPPIK